MRIDKLWIPKFKNLRNFEIDFDEDQLISVIVGRNGTGKSNLLEAIVSIFRNIDLGLDPGFTYRITYQISLTQDRRPKYKIEIDADPLRERRADFYKIEITENETGQIVNPSFRSFSSESSLGIYRPRFIFGYYSGHSPRLEELFIEHKRRFYQELLRDENQNLVLRPFLYAELIYSPFALLTFFINQGKDDEVIRKFMAEYLRIGDLHSVLFVMREPDWASNEGDERFWKARGAVREFLDRLYSVAVAPLRLEQRIPLEFRKFVTKEHLYLYLPDQQALQDLADIYPNQQEFFKALESTYLSNLTHEVRIRFRTLKADDTLIFRELSEGEQQLLMVLGLMRFTKEDESLFLLDEPDTHLNPSWSIEYLEFIQQIVGNQETSQVLILTHNPLTLASLKKQQVKILYRDEEGGQIYAKSAEDDPRGMGVAGILTSDIFGLRSILDPKTLKLLDRQRELSLESDKRDLNSQEQAELEDLTEKVSNLDFTRVVRDPLYKPYVKAMTEYTVEEGLQEELTLTERQQKDMKNRALDIIRRLKKGEKPQ